MVVHTCTMAAIQPPPTHMKLGDVVNDQPLDEPRPLSGIRVLAAEQMAALPFATQLLARLGG